VWPARRGQAVASRRTAPQAAVLATERLTQSALRQLNPPHTARQTRPAAGHPTHPLLTLTSLSPCASGPSHSDAPHTSPAPPTCPVCRQRPAVHTAAAGSPAHAHSHAGRRHTAAGAATAVAQSHTGRRSPGTLRQRRASARGTRHSPVRRRRAEASAARAVYAARRARQSVRMRSQERRASHLVGRTGVAWNTGRDMMLRELQRVENAALPEQILDVRCKRVMSGQVWRRSELREAPAPQSPPLAPLGRRGVDKAHSDSTSPRVPRVDLETRSPRI